MQFCDKLDFLMKISNTANKELAQGIAVDRSLVSLLRTGRRPRPRNLDHIHRIARFLAPRITTDFQRHAVADMLGQISIRSSLPTDMLVDALEKWLIGDQDMVDHFVDSLTAPPAPTTPPLPQPQQSVSRDTRFFFGNEGRREAMRYMASMLNGLKDPCDILVASDGNMDWLLEDYDFSCEMRDGLVTAMDREITLYQILPSMNFINSYIESLRFWLPMYTSGRARVFYYPRLRDNLYRHSSIIVPGHAVNSVSGIGLQSTTQVSMVSGQPELINAYSALFQNHLALCRPAMELHSSMSEYAACYRDYFSRDGAIIQQVSPLPITTMPPELMRYYQSERQPLLEGHLPGFPGPASHAPHPHEGPELHRHRPARLRPGHPGGHGAGGLPDADPPRSALLHPGDLRAAPEVHPPHDGDQRELLVHPLPRRATQRLQPLCQRKRPRPYRPARAAHPHAGAPPARNGAGLQGIPAAHRGQGWLRQHPEKENRHGALRSDPGIAVMICIIRTLVL